MSETSVQLLATFDTLPPNEQRAVLTAMLKRTGELPDDLLPEDGLVELADELFQALDAEESHDDDAQSR